ncbi:alcohol acetyltransferase [Purpureocillium lavendulum]|uniref:Alcohol acetyltransferase n=1 Tax=Purpureocillium lavendulum TaxID=1247861 RepID=A0AB34G3S0_9HYPO|nr:alcohol acetyltransferase [Purpureocillium lavendulum]
MDVRSGDAVEATSYLGLLEGDLCTGWDFNRRGAEAVVLSPQRAVEPVGRVPGTEATAPMRDELQGHRATTETTRSSPAADMAAAADAQAAQMPFIKNLASSDRKLRTQSLAALQSFLSTRPPLPAADAAKLWTGLYYALWMTDRPRPQQALAADLAGLLFALRPGDHACAAPWLRAFWAVLSANWARVDALRMDKFLLLVRRVFAAHLRWIRERGYCREDQRRLQREQEEDDEQQQQQKEGGDERKTYADGDDPVEDVLRVLEQAAFDVDEESRTALGLRLHLLDLWVDELEREGCLAPLPEPDAEARRAAFVARVGAMVERLRRSPVRSVRARAQDTYDDERLPWGTPAAASDDEDGDEDMGEGGGDDDSEDGWGGIED